MVVKVFYLGKQEAGFAGIQRSPSPPRTAPLVCDALQMALWKRHRPTGAIVHPDRGNNYVRKCAVHIEV